MLFHFKLRINVDLFQSIARFALLFQVALDFGGRPQFVQLSDWSERLSDFLEGSSRPAVDDGVHVVLVLGFSAGRLIAIVVDPLVQCS